MIDMKLLRERVSEKLADTVEALTPDQARALLQFDPMADWQRIRIDRSGRSKRLAAARNQLAKKGLLEKHPEIRFAWRATMAGRIAIGAIKFEKAVNPEKE